MNDKVVFTMSRETISDVSSADLLPYGKPPMVHGMARFAVARRRLTLFAIAVVCVLLAACDGNDDTSAEPSASGSPNESTPDETSATEATTKALVACEVFGPELAEEFLGAPVKLSNEQSFSLASVDDSECSYDRTDHGIDGLASVSIGILSATSETGMQSVRAAFSAKKDSSFDFDGDTPAVTVDGAADAFWDGTNHRLWVLIDDGATVLKAGVLVGFDPELDETDIAARLAERVLAAM